MGLASSQARMLLLTARKSDLEYRAQMISQRKINLAMQTQQLATEYSQAMSNRRLDLVYYTDGNNSKVMTEKLSYSGIMAANSSTVGDYLVVTSNGKYVYTGNNEEEQLQNVYNVASKLFSAYGFQSDADGAKQRAYNEAISSGNETAARNMIMNEYWSQMTYVAGANNSDFFQSSLRNGSLYLQKAEVTNATTTDDTNPRSIKTGYSLVSWGALDCINDNLNTVDDASAEAEYESKSLVLSNQDKMLDLELNQIETQHKAIETEYDSVKKVIEKNIDVSFKIFS